MLSVLEFFSPISECVVSLSHSGTRVSGIRAHWRRHVFIASAFLMQTTIWTGDEFCLYMRKSEDSH